jgi:hypothetical protein
MPYAVVILRPCEKQAVIVIVVVCLLLNPIRGEELFIYSHLVDALLRKLERGEENGIDDARAGHGNAEATVHARIHELNLRSSRFVTAADEAVALVDALRCVNREDLYRIQYLFSIS